MNAENQQDTAMMSRRTFIGYATTTIVGGTIWLAQSRSALATAPSQPQGPYKLPPLGYAYDALEPYIDAETMQLHHDKHHAAYVENLNKAMQGQSQAGQPPEELLRNLGQLPANIRTPVRNNAGGDANHTMFWEIMKPGGSKQPTGELANAINSTFGSFDVFKSSFNDAGVARFGSGWVWLVRGQDGRLQITSTPNQDSPYLNGNYPIMGNDVWEHAYYLKYQNRRPEYLDAWWNVVNWDVVGQRYAQAQGGGSGTPQATQTPQGSATVEATGTPEATVTPEATATVEETPSP